MTDKPQPLDLKLYKEMEKEIKSLKKEVSRLKNTNKEYIEDMKRAQRNIEIILGSIAIIIESALIGATHREKNERLRGLLCVIRDQLKHIELNGIWYPNKHFGEYSRFGRLI